MGTATDGDDTYVFLHNPNAAAITVNYTTRVGSGSFTIPAKDTYRFLMPQNSGAQFASAGGEPFFAVGTVGAEPTQNNVHDWGFSLVPALNLTTELVVGWGPGTQRPHAANGNPAWVTAVRPTTIYVDYNGDRAGSLTDPNGGKYDVAYTVSALEVSPHLRARQRPDRPAHLHARRHADHRRLGARPRHGRARQSVSRRRHRHSELPDPGLAQDGHAPHGQQPSPA